MGKTYKFQKLKKNDFFKPKSTYRKNLKNPDSLDFLGFFTYTFLACQMHIFTDIKYVFLPRKWFRKHVCHMYGKYVFLPIPKPKNTYMYVCHTYF